MKPYLIVGLITFGLMSCSKLQKDEVYDYPSYERFRLEKTAINFIDGTTLFVFPDQGYFYETIASNPGFVLNFIKESEVVYSSKCTTQKIDEVCIGAYCYLTYLNVSAACDTFHFVFDGGKYLMREFPINRENLDAFLDSNYSNSDVVTIWNYYSRIEQVI